MHGLSDHTQTTHSCLLLPAYSLARTTHNKQEPEMKAKTAKLDDFLHCPDTNPLDKVHLLVVQSRQFLQLSLLQRSLYYQYCHIVGLSSEDQGGIHYSSLTVKIQPGSNTAACTVTVPPSQMSRYGLHSICYSYMINMLSEETEMQKDWSKSPESQNTGISHNNKAANVKLICNS